MNIIVAKDIKNGIGRDNGLLAHISPDLKYFKEKTLNKIVVMGYNTYLSLPIRPLPNRETIVLCDKDIEIDGVTVVNSLDECLDIIKILEDQGKEVFICGGASMYKQFIDYCDKLYVTQILRGYDADTFFPEINLDKFQLVSCYGDRENLTHEHPHVFQVFEKRV